MKHNGYPSRRAQRFFRSVRRWEAKRRRALEDALDIRGNARALVELEDRRRRGLE